jgi:pimeloyl-ACP methyl ester carboxylesterase
MPPEIRYAKSDGVHIAYTVLGRGPIDLVYVPGWVSHLDCAWEEPDFARYYERLAAFSRLILFDKRGTGLSDRAADLPTLEQRMDDVRAVMDAAGSARAAVMGVSEGGVMSALFAATYPERTSALILYATYARRIWAPDYPWAPTSEERQQYVDAIERGWGTELTELAIYAPTMASDERFRRWWDRYRRLSASPGAALALARMNTEADIRRVLPSIRVPTLVLHRTGDRDMNVAEGRYIAARIPGAKFVELPGEDHLPFLGDADALLDEVEEFLTGVRRGPEPDRVLATILFADIVASTERAASAGDRRWRTVLESYHTMAQAEIERHRGRVIDTAGDGIFAAFDGPARAVRCACAIGECARTMGLEVRAGLHTGECETVQAKLGGIAVHIGARVGAAAGPGQVLVSSTVKDLVAGSGLRFADRGTRVLAGVPGEWHLFAADPASARLDR